MPLHSSRSPVAHSHQSILHPPQPPTQLKFLPEHWAHPHPLPTPQGLNVTLSQHTHTALHATVTTHRLFKPHLPDSTQYWVGAKRYNYNTHNNSHRMRTRGGPKHPPPPPNTEAYPIAFAHRSLVHIAPLAAPSLMGLHILEPPTLFTNHISNQPKSIQVHLPNP